MIRTFSDLTLSGGLTLVYGGIAAAVASGAALGVFAVLLSSAARGGGS